MFSFFRLFFFGTSYQGPYLIQKQMKEIIEQLGCPKEEFQPALIHCGAGKDRTAFTVAVILKLLGVRCVKPCMVSFAHYLHIMHCHACMFFPVGCT